MHVYIGHTLSFDSQFSDTSLKQREKTNISLNKQNMVVNPN